MIKWQITTYEEGRQLIDALSLRIPSVPYGYLRQLMKKQRVKVGSCVANPDQTIQSGETVSVKVSQRLESLLEGCPLLPDQILYEDTQCLVISKPSGLATHRARGHSDNLTTRAQDYLLLRGEKFAVAPVQRLDIGTSGAIMIGKGKRATRALGKLMMEGGISKHYLALVHGQTPEQGTLSSPVRAKGKIKAAETHFNLLESQNDFSLLTLSLETGRQHQIRQQLANFKHPIAGDKRYGNFRTQNFRRIMLHCHQLCFQSPLSGQLAIVTSPMTIDFHKQLVGLGFAVQMADPS